VVGQKKLKGRERRREDYSRQRKRIKRKRDKSDKREKEPGINQKSQRKS
jgi:hypothetical protein